MDIDVNKLVLRKAPTGILVLIAITNEGEYHFLDGNKWTLAAFPADLCPEINNSNPNCKGKCENVYQRGSGILKCKDCGKVFY